MVQEQSPVIVDNNYKMWITNYNKINKWILVIVNAGIGELTSIFKAITAYQATIQ